MAIIAYKFKESVMLNVVYFRSDQSLSRVRLFANP